MLFGPPPPSHHWPAAVSGPIRVDRGCGDKCNLPRHAQYVCPQTVPRRFRRNAGNKNKKVYFYINHFFFFQELKVFEVITVNFVITYNYRCEISIRTYVCDHCGIRVLNLFDRQFIRTRVLTRDGRFDYKTHRFDGERVKRASKT